MEPRTRPFARRVLVAVVLLLLAVANGCGKSEEKAPGAACDLIDRDLISELADGREWHDVGSLYFDGRFRDGCDVVSQNKPLLVVTLVDFRGSVDADPARETLLEERRALQRTCPGTAQVPVTEDTVTAECLSERKLDYNEWNPRRLVRLTIFRQPGLSVSRDVAVRISDDLNRRADKIETENADQ
jgi:hypothetical protein